MPKPAPLLLSLVSYTASKGKLMLAVIYLSAE